MVAARRAAGDLAAGHSLEVDLVAGWHAVEDRARECRMAVAALAVAFLLQALLALVHGEVRVVGLTGVEARAQEAGRWLVERRFGPALAVRVSFGRVAGPLFDRAPVQRVYPLPALVRDQAQARQASAAQPAGLVSGRASARVLRDRRVTMLLAVSQTTPHRRRSTPKQRPSARAASHIRPTVPRRLPVTPLPGIPRMW